jgi:hypothetical protein
MESEREVDGLREKLDSLKPLYLKENPEERTILRSYGNPGSVFFLEVFSPRFINWLADKVVKAMIK